MSASKFLLKSLLKHSLRPKRVSGFTLLELLVALILTFLIITPLLSLVISLMGTDRQEQAKNSSQQEIQAALDYIAQDLQQAVYIYDATALKNPTSSTPAQSGILNQIPPVANPVTGCPSIDTCVPVLAFWKRKYLDRNDTVDNVKISDIDDLSKGSDRFVYSLVVYYLIKDSNQNNQNNTQTWSPTARIGRVEIRDGIKAPSSGGSNATISYLLNPDQGFNSFNPGAVPGSLQQSMNSWQKSSSTYTKTVDILVDYIDDTLLADFPGAVQTQINQPDNNTTDPNNSNALASDKCDQRLVSPTFTQGNTTSLPPASRVPPDNIIPDQLKTGSFYACVKPINTQGQSVVQVYLRGNALPRLNKNSQTWQVNAANQETQLSYRPTANVRVAVRGLLGGTDSK